MTQWTAGTRQLLVWMVILASAVGITANAEPGDRDEDAVSRALLQLLLRAQQSEKLSDSRQEPPQQPQQAQVPMSQQAQDNQPQLQPEILQPILPPVVPNNQASSGPFQPQDPGPLLAISAKERLKRAVTQKRAAYVGNQPPELQPLHVMRDKELEGAEGVSREAISRYWTSIQNTVDDSIMSLHGLKSLLQRYSVTNPDLTSSLKLRIEAMLMTIRQSDGDPSSLFATPAERRSLGADRFELGAQALSEEVTELRAYFYRTIRKENGPLAFPQNRISKGLRPGLSDPSSSLSGSDTHR